MLHRPQPLLSHMSMSYHPPTTSNSYTERSVIPPGTLMHHSPTAAPLIHSPSGSQPLPSFNSPLIHKTSPPLPAINPNGPFPPVLEMQHPFSPHSRSSSSGVSIIPSPPPIYPSATAPPNSNSGNMRFEVVLEAPTAAAQKVEESPLTYLNKGQFYNIALKDTEAQDIELVSTVHIMFHDESHRKVAPNYWKFWLSQQKKQQTARAIDIDQGRSVGVHNIETRWFDRITFQWNGKAGATINIRFNCLSTDFSRIKGVKGIPLRLHMETHVVQSEQQQQQHQVVETAFCRIKLFRDKGAERKNKDDAKHIEKQLEKLRGKNGESHPLWLAYSQTQPYTVFCEVPSSPTTSTSGTPSDLEAVRRMSDGSISTTTANNGAQPLSRTSSQHNGMFLPPPPSIIPNFSQHHPSMKRPYPTYHQYHPLVSPPPVPYGHEISPALASTLAASSGNPYFMQPAAIDLDPTYMPQRKRRVAKKSIFVKSAQSNEAYYRAVYLDDLTVENLIQNLTEKLNIKTDQKVQNVIRQVVKKENLAVCIDDSVVQDIPEEQDMEVETTTNDDGSITLVLRY